MSDIKTQLRELSVATTIGLLKSGIDFELTNLISPKHFMAYTNQVVSNNTSLVENLRDYAIFSDDLKSIIENGYHLGKKIYENPYFIFNKCEK